MGPVETRIDALANELFEPTDLTSPLLTPSLKARSAAFLVLAHAEIEHAIEEQCLRTAGLLRSAVEPVTAMMAWSFAGVRDDGSLVKAKKKLPLDELVTRYARLVESNHGIKAPNLHSLLVPLGVDLLTLKTDIIALSEFGERRGDLAHRPLASWPTVDLPSAHMRTGLQAGQSADRIVASILSGHARISYPPTLGHRSALLMRMMASTFRRWGQHRR